MDSDEDPSSLLALLEGSDYRGLHRRFSSFLKPFHPFLSSSATSKSTKKDKKIRDLCSKYLPFLNSLIKILSKQCSQPPKSTADRDAMVEELFSIYRLYIDCMSCVAPALVLKPYSDILWRVSYLRRLCDWCRYRETEEEGLAVLSELRSRIGGDAAKLLPEPQGEFENPELAADVAHVVSRMARCAYGKESFLEEDYQRVLALLDQVRPWLRLADSEVSEKLLGTIVWELYHCTLFIMKHFSNFNEDLLCCFCVETLAECLKSSRKFDLIKMARKFCFSFEPNWAKSPLVIRSILKSALGFIVCECKHGTVNANDILDLLYHFATKCQNQSSVICKEAEEFLLDIAADFFQVLPHIACILTFYAAGLFFEYASQKARQTDAMSEGLKSASAISLFLDNEVLLENLARSLCALRRHVEQCSNITTELPGPCIYKICDSSHEQVSLLSYVQALGYFCTPLVETIRIIWEQNYRGKDVVQLPACVNCIQDALYQFCDVLLFGLSNASDELVDKLRKHLLAAGYGAIAGFRVALLTYGNFQKSISCVQQVITMNWLKPHDLRSVAVSLYNIGVDLYNSKNLEQASIALNLSFQAIWAHVSLLGCKYAGKADGSADDLTQDALKDSISSSCAYSSFYLDVLHQCGNESLHEILAESLLNWSSANDLSKSFFSPMVLVKQWVKIVFKEFQNILVEDNVPMLSTILSSSSKNFSTASLGTILEQELIAYAEMEARQPAFCRAMQHKITDVLLQELYLKKDYSLQRARVLLSKSRLARMDGTDGLKLSIQHLSEAISILEDFSAGPYERDMSLHQLVLTYCLRALCLEESDHDSEVFLHDISRVLKIWSNTDVTSLSLCKADVIRAIPLLYHIADLLSLKGFAQLQNEICKHIFILYKWNNVSMEESLTILLGGRWLNHAICGSPLDEAFIAMLCKRFDIPANSVDFWMNAMKSSQPLLLGLKQKLSISSSHCAQLVNQHSGGSKSSVVTSEDVTEAASAMMAHGPVSGNSAFVAGCLYYDLSERLASSGQLVEGLLYATEALRLRKMVLFRFFKHSYRIKPSKFAPVVDIHQLEAWGSLVAIFWPDIAKEEKTAGPILSPWNILKCYLESVLQVGNLYELTRNAEDAELLFLVGKNISCVLGLPIFRVMFESLLGKLYLKRELPNLAESELNSAKQIVGDCNMGTVCTHCKLILDVSLDMRFGDLKRVLSNKNGQMQPGQSEPPSLGVYTSALDKLNFAELNCPFLHCEDKNVKIVDSDGPILKLVSISSNAAVHLSNKAKQLEACEYCSTSEPKMAFEYQSKPKHNSEVPSALPVDIEVNPEHKRPRRSTRTRKTSKQVQEEQCSKRKDTTRTGSDHQFSHRAQSDAEGQFECLKTSNCRTRTQEQRTESTNNVCDEACRCHGAFCLRCLIRRVVEAGSVHGMICIKREYQRRHLLLSLFHRIRKCTEACGEVHEVHKIFWRSIFILYDRKLLSEAYSEIQHCLLLELFGRESPTDLFALGRARLLYNICWFSVKQFFSKKHSSSANCCLLSDIKMPTIVSWLLQAFLVCRHVPLLLKKVTRLLAVIYLLSTFGAPFPSLVSDKLVASSWAAYFHQVSIGTGQHHKYLSILNERLDLCSSGNSELSSLTIVVREAQESLRIAPDKLEDLEEFIDDYFRRLPGITIICLCFLGSGYTFIFKNMLSLATPISSWMLFSRISSNQQPVTVILPMNQVPEEQTSVNFDLQSIFVTRDKWICPWSSNVIDDVAPQFRSMLEESHSCSKLQVDDDISRTMYWVQKAKLNKRLENFTRSLEDLCFGTWRFLLLGDPFDCPELDRVRVKLVRELKQKLKYEAHETLVQIFLSAKYELEIENWIAQLLAYRGCFARGNWEPRSLPACLSVEEVKDNISDSSYKLILKAIRQLEEKHFNRRSIVLVLDADMQMLPWESLPTLRKQEVYRMPSVNSIFALLKQMHNGRGLGRRYETPFPLVNPFDAYFLLNPSGDLHETQTEFEDLFKREMTEGRVCSVPPFEELASALQKHDLFIYFGHGSGEQFWPRKKIENLDRCAATLLMGCSSGSLVIKGQYTPEGPPLSYLLAGCPAIIANLWDVLSNDINRYCKVLLDAWLRDASQTDSGEELRFASLMGKARDACRFPFLTGAAPVCYGVPTRILKKDT
ncbi:Peptidase C50 separase protein [Dioscorea alata]|uniref:Peptidase C50 separase protein n=1 Tax=Dioscorea alata TaxID=55571 RepID=A0ACB7U8V4_DIOAL|nr:Peptidase C50 separase protein [Dioscorea alata]